MAREIKLLFLVILVLVSGAGCTSGDEELALFYRVNFNKGRETLVRLKMENRNGEWQVRHLRQGAQYQTGK